MADEYLQVNNEVLVPGLSYGMKNVSSMITSRREVTVFAQPGSFQPPSGRLIKFHIADASSWWQLATTKLVFELENRNLAADGATAAAHPLELLGPPTVCIDTLRILSQGVIIENIESYARTVNTWEATLPKQTREQQGMQAVPMKDAYGAHTAGAEDDAEPSRKYLAPQEYLTLGPGEKRTVSCTLLSALMNSGYCWPLMHASCTVELLLQVNCPSVCADTFATVNGVAARDRSVFWGINLPRLCMSFNTLSSVGQAEFDSLIAGQGLVLFLNSHTTLQQSIASKDPRVQFFRSLANVTDIFCTLHREIDATHAIGGTEDNSDAKGRVLLPLNTAGLRDCIAGKLKECNYLWNPEQLVTDGLETAAAVAGQGEFSLQINWGAKQIPEIAASGGQLMSHLMMALGMEQAREGFSDFHSYNHNKFLMRFNLEVYTGTELDNAGLSSRAGESIQIVMKNAGTSANYATKLFVHLRSTTKCEIRTGSVRVLD